MNVSYNKISQLEDILNLKFNYNLRELNMMNNPIQKNTREYRSNISYVFYNLRMLDTVKVERKRDSISEQQ